MPDGEPLIATLTIGLAFAFAGGLLAQKLHLPVLLGYLLGGMAVGPFTPGFVANPEIARQLAEVGLILLMFGVGLRFSLRELLAVRGIAIAGGVGQVTIVTLLVAWFTTRAGWDLGEAVILGLALSIASTVVALRVLAQRGELATLPGHITVGWLLIEDLIAIGALVLLPLFLPTGGEPDPASTGEFLALSLGLLLAKLTGFTLVMVLVGNRVLPWVLSEVARAGSRELFTLGVLVSALGVAFGATALFGLSFALGAFVAGVVVGESDLSQQAAADALPLRDAFAVLFFVSVGMIFDPTVVLTDPTGLLAVLMAVVLLTPLVTAVIVFGFGYPLRTCLTVPAALAQIGEFSFVLAELGRHLGMLPHTGYNLVIAGAFVSIAINPAVFRFAGWIERRLAAWEPASRAFRWRAGPLAHLPEQDRGKLRNHALLCGHGRVGRLIALALGRRGLRYVVMEENRSLVEHLRRQGVPALFGDASNPALLEDAGLATARILVVAIPDPEAVRRIVDHARRLRPDLDIVARTHTEDEWLYLRENGRVNEAVLGERELAVEMVRHTLQRFGVSTPETNAIAQRLRLGLD